MEIVKENVGYIVALITLLKACCTWCCRKTGISRDSSDSESEADIENQLPRKNVSG